MDLGLGPLPITQVPEVVLYKLITAFFCFTFIVLLATYLLPQKIHYALAWASVGLDVLFAVSLVTISHATESVFLFGLPLAVLGGAALLERPGALIAAGLCSAFVVVISLLDAGILTFDLEPWTVAWLRELGIRELPKTGFEIVVQAAVLMAALLGTALLSSQLVIELNRARQRAVTERRELAALRVRYEDVWSSLPDGLATIARDGQVRTANPAFLRILGLETQQVVDQSLKTLLPELDWDPIMPVQTVEIPRSSQTEELSRDDIAGDEQIIAMRGEILRDADGRPTGESLLLIRDVTKIRQREREHLNRERLATVGAMAMAIAHEIRNPLASISGSIQMLNVDDNADDEDRRLMDIAIRETENLSAWIGEFLDYAKPGSVTMESFDMLELIQDTLAAMEKDPLVTDANVDLRIRINCEDGGIRGDRKALSALVWNLLRNATDAVLEVDRRIVEVHVTAEPDELCIVVADSGRGIDPQEREHLFEPFYTTRVKGTGLGLATVARVVQAHKGTVDVGEAALGGAVFTVKIPRNRRKEGSAHRSAS